MPIHAPYNFVPLNQYVYIPEWGGKISIDKPFKEGEDGIITINCKNLTPIFIGSSKGVLSYIEDERRDKHYYIPATSLKGMLRSVLEIMTFSKLNTNQYNDDSFGYRVFNNADLGKTYRENMSFDKEECGWLIKKASGAYAISSCGSPKKYEIAEIIKIESFENYNSSDSNITKRTFFRNASKDKSYPDNEFPLIGNEKEKGNLVCSGRTIPHTDYRTHRQIGKVYECIFPKIDAPNYVDVNDSVIKTFITSYKASKDYYYSKNHSAGTLLDYLATGKKIPVFFHRENGEIASIGLTRCYRFPYKRKVSDGINQVFVDKSGKNIKKEDINKVFDISECIFGLNNDNNALKGRVSFGNAFFDKEDISPLPSIEGVLGSPSASYYPLYLVQNPNRPVTYNSSAITISGRKRYSVHSNNYLTSLPVPNKNDSKMKTRISFLPSGLSFHFTIRVHNLLPEEIGALLTSITFNGDDYAHHNIGMAKGFGYGKIAINSISLGSSFKQEKDNYINRFKDTITIFTKKMYNMEWSSTKEIKQIISLAHDHTEGLELMSLQEYKQYK